MWICSSLKRRDVNFYSCCWGVWGLSPSTDLWGWVLVSVLLFSLSVHAQAADAIWCWSSEQEQKNVGSTPRGDDGSQTRKVNEFMQKGSQQHKQVGGRQVGFHANNGWSLCKDTQTHTHTLRCFYKYWHFVIFLLVHSVGSAVDLYNTQLSSGILFCLSLNTSFFSKKQKPLNISSPRIHHIV